MSEPEKLPRWATEETFDPETGQINVIEPPEEKKNIGWSFREKGVRNWFNWLFRTIYEWIVHLRDEINSLKAGTSPVASTTQRGFVELATETETQAGTDSERAITPAGLQSKVATSTARGIVELATLAEVEAATDTERAVTPAGLASLQSAILALEDDVYTFDLYQPAILSYANPIAAVGSWSQLGSGSVSTADGGRYWPFIVQNPVELVFTLNVPPNTQLLGVWPLAVFSFEENVEADSIRWRLFPNGGPSGGSVRDEIFSGDTFYEWNINNPPWNHPLDQATSVNQAWGVGVDIANSGGSFAASYFTIRGFIVRVGPGSPSSF